jgi:porphobilinogen synthase
MTLLKDHPCLPVRMRRLRRMPAMRRLLQDVHLSPSDFIAPLFITADRGQKKPIASMPGQHRWSVDRVCEAVDALREAGVPAVMLFGLPDHKDPLGEVACQHDGVVQRAIRAIKAHAPELVVMADLCFCEYTSHGHCGVLSPSSGGDPVLDNDASLVMLQKQALSLAEAGADVLAPSGMLDGMIASVRQALDAQAWTDVALLSYAVKYASHAYGPFRDAADGAPQSGDRRGYQMDYANRAQAWREADLDVAEGADMLMVKPATLYLDIIAGIKARHPGMPLMAYQVSGTYSMMQHAMEQGMMDPVGGMLESLIAIKRAGADAIITYYALDAARACAAG